MAKQKTPQIKPAQPPPATAADIDAIEKRRTEEKQKHEAEQEQIANECTEKLQLGLQKTVEGVFLIAEAHDKALRELDKHRYSTWLATKAVCDKSKADRFISIWRCKWLRENTE